MSPIKSLLARFRKSRGGAKEEDGSSRRSGPLQIHHLVLTGATFDSDVGSLFKNFREGRHEPDPISHQGLYPDFYDTNPKTLDLLETLVLHLKPEMVVETGVANGASTRRILSALSQNRGNGKLISCDIDDRVATAELMADPRFEFVKIGSPSDFSDLVERLDKIDVFYHDSDHSYNHQLFEYSTVWEKLPPGGILVSDDIHWSYAFLDFCVSVGRVPYVLSDTQKFSGFIQK
jgi:predicted O-methyltransferase YrrM